MQNGSREGSFWKNTKRERVWIKRYYGSVRYFPSYCCRCWMYCPSFQPPQKEFSIGSRDTKIFKIFAVSPRSRWALTASIGVTRLHYTQTRFFSPTFPGFFQVFASFSIFGVLHFLVFIHSNNSASWKQKKGGGGEGKGRRRNPTQIFFFFKKKRSNPGSLCQIQFRVVGERGREKKNK